MANHSINSISVYYQNCRGTRTKLNTIYLNILSNDYDVIVLTETWLIPAIHDRELIDQRYMVFRCDRDFIATNKEEGGGLLIAVLRKLRPTLVNLTLTQYSHLEHVVVQIPSTSGLRTMRHLISAAYIPPNTPDDVYDTHFNYLQSLVHKENIDNFFIIGDYNIPTAKWIASDTSHNGLICDSGGPQIHSILRNFMSRIQGLQFNNTLNKNNRILDLFISNTDCDIYSPISISLPIDILHPPFCILTYITLAPSLKRSTVKRLNYHKSNYELINRDIGNIDWTHELNHLLPEQAVEHFYNLIHGICLLHTPFSSGRTSQFPIWFTPSLIHIHKNKSRYWAKWKIYKNISDYEIFSLYRKRFKLQCDACFKLYMESVEDSIKNNPKFFWSYVANRNAKSGIPSTMSYHASTSDDPSEICNMFSNFFRRNFELSTLDLNQWAPPSTYADSDNVVCNLSFSEANIHSALLQLDNTKGPGPDGLPAIFLIRTAASITKPLHIIYNKCMCEGTFPSCWKLAHITPIHKGGSKQNVEQYRPISMLSILSKVFERLVHNSIYPTLHGSILRAQHGFVKRRSTVTNLMVFVNDLFENMERTLQVDAVYTDFRKAFDKVDHELLLNKIAFNGIRGNLLRWFASYISNRTQVIVVKGFRSNIERVTSGVPQGSILGPLLFVLFINDIDSCFHNSNYLLYADDLKVYKTITSVEDGVKLQEDLDRLSNYCLLNKLQFNLSKCNSITYTKKIHTFDSTYYLCNTNLSKVTSIRDLGVTLDSKLHLDQHIDKIISKAYQLFGFIMRSGKDFVRHSTYLHLFKSLVRPQLEYATTIWNPYYNKYADAIESVQYKFLKSMQYRCFQGHMPYHMLLAKYSMMTLHSRRQLLDATTLHGICNNRYDCIDLTNKICYLIPRSVHRRQVRSRKLFALNRCKSNAGKRAPVQRLVDTYNNTFIDLDIFSLTLPRFRALAIEFLLVVGGEEESGGSAD